MAAHGVSAESVVRGRDTENLRACAESVAARAQEHLESSREEVYRIIRLNRLINNELIKPQIPCQVLEQGGEAGDAACRRRRRLPRQAPQGKVQPLRPKSQQEGPHAAPRPFLAETEKHLLSGHLWLQ